MPPFILPPQPPAPIPIEVIAPAVTAVGDNQTMPIAVTPADGITNGLIQTPRFAHTTSPSATNSQNSSGITTPEVLAPQFSENIADQEALLNSNTNHRQTTPNHLQTREIPSPKPNLESQITKSETNSHNLVSEQQPVIPTISFGQQIPTIKPIEVPLEQNHQQFTHFRITDPSGNITQYQLGQQPLVIQEQQYPVILNKKPKNQNNQPKPSDNSQPIEVQLEPEVPIRALEINADRQEYDQVQQVVTAEGNVIMRFNLATLIADRLQINLTNRIAVAEGNVALKRGNQILRGNRFEYFFFRDNGVISDAQGEINQPTLATDLNTLSSDANGNILTPEPLSDRLSLNQPVTGITANPGFEFSGKFENIGLGPQDESDPNQESFTVGEPKVGGNVNRIRFQAEKVEFQGEAWQATNLRLTNDPFSPPELEIRADTANFSRISPEATQLITTKSRVVFNNTVSLPLFKNRFIFDKSEPALFRIGYDQDDRGGLFIERQLTAIRNNRINWTITPQYLVQKSLFPDLFNSDSNNDDSDGILSVFGLKSNLSWQLTPTTSVKGKLNLSSLAFNDLQDDARGSLRLQQQFGSLVNPHTLNFEYSYRDRLFNGSLGYQTVQSSVGAVLTSPSINLWKSGVNLSYQLGIQNVDADTDRVDLLPPINERDNDRVNLTRYQGAISLNKYFRLWSGKPLEMTPTAALRYSPRPIVPYLGLSVGTTGVVTYYSNGDNQNSLTASIGLQGQFGHFSRNFLDYTGFNIQYTEKLGGKGESPFYFDRFADERTLSWGITQQIFGPIRFGIQSSLNLDTGEQISTDFLLEYSRRTHAILLRYNPELDLGAIIFRISDFNWLGTGRPFEDSNIKPVIQGVTR